MATRELFLHRKNKTTATIEYISSVVWPKLRHLENSSSTDSSTLLGLCDTSLRNGRQRNAAAASSDFQIIENRFVPPPLFPPPAVSIYFPPLTTEKEYQSL